MLHAAAFALLPVLVVGVAAALAPGRTVGSVVIAALGAVLAYVGGVVLGQRAADRIPALASHAQGHRLTSLMSLAVHAAGVLAAVTSGWSALACSVAGSFWSARIGFLGARDLIGVAAPQQLRVVAACAFAVNAPALLRSALYAL